MDTEQNKFLAAIGYIPFLCFLPIYIARDDEFAQFHGKQSLILLVTYIIISLGLWLISLIFGGILGHIILLGYIFKILSWLAHNFIGTILSIVYVVVLIIGFIYAVSGNIWEIPIISTYAKKLII